MHFSRIWEERSILKEVGKGKHKVNYYIQDRGPVIGNCAVSFLGLMPEGPSLVIEGGGEACMGCSTLKLV